MLRKIADNKAELNFHFIMEAIKQENIKRAHDRLKDQKDNESKNKSASNSGALGTSGSPEKKSSSAATSIEPVNITDDYLVTYREFMSALQREFPITNHAVSRGVAYCVQPPCSRCARK